MTSRWYRRTRMHRSSPSAAGEGAGDTTCTAGSAAGSPTCRAPEEAAGAWACGGSPLGVMVPP
eukprot:2261535-Prorocentrum_lima.AAC.1